LFASKKKRKLFKKYKKNSSKIKEIQLFFQDFVFVLKDYLKLDSKGKKVQVFLIFVKIKINL